MNAGKGCCDSEGRLLHGAELEREFDLEGGAVTSEQIERYNYIQAACLFEVGYHDCLINHPNPQYEGQKAIIAGTIPPSIIWRANRLAAVGAGLTLIPRGEGDPDRPVNGYI